MRRQAAPAAGWRYCDEAVLTNSAQLARDCTQATIDRAREQADAAGRQQHIRLTRAHQGRSTCQGPVCTEVEQVR